MQTFTREKCRCSFQGRNRIVWVVFWQTVKLLSVSARFGLTVVEMGLGKTIQMLALIHSNIPEDIEVPKQSTALLPHEPKVHTIDYAPYTTLVIAPMSLLSQWESECDAASKPNTLKTMVYYA